MAFQDGMRMFGDIKSKLGFSSKDQDVYDEGYDDYGDYADDYGDYADDYAEYADEAPASAHDRYTPSSSRSAARGSSSSSMPRLVSIDDVRANTQVPSSLSRDPLPPRHVTSSAAATSRAFGRTMVDSSLPPQMTPEGTAAVSAAASRRRSEGLDSLFTPTVSDGADAAEPRLSAREQVESIRSQGSASAHAASSFGQREAAYAVSGMGPASSYTGRRTLTVLKPASYAEVEGVAKSLKAGEAVILCLGNTPDGLSKRILDFSFGVASALEASVECVGDKVFAVTCGTALSEVERMNLRNQGVL